MSDETKYHPYQTYNCTGSEKKSEQRASQWFQVYRGVLARVLDGGEGPDRSHAFCVQVKVELVEADDQVATVSQMSLDVASRDVCALDFPSVRQRVTVVLGTLATRLETLARILRERGKDFGTDEG